MTDGVFRKNVIIIHLHKTGVFIDFCLLWNESGLCLTSRAITVWDRDKRIILTLV